MSKKESKPGKTKDGAHLNTPLKSVKGGAELKTPAKTSAVGKTKPKL